MDFVIKVYRPNVEPRFPDGGKMSMHLENLKVCGGGGKGEGGGVASEHACMCRFWVMELRYRRGDMLWTGVGEGGRGDGRAEGFLRGIHNSLPP